MQILCKNGSWCVSNMYTIVTSVGYNCWVNLNNQLEPGWESVQSWQLEWLCGSRVISGAADSAETKQWTKESALCQRRRSHSGIYAACSSYTVCIYYVLICNQQSRQSQFLVAFLGDDGCLASAKVGDSTVDIWAPPPTGSQIVLKPESSVTVCDGIILRWVIIWSTDIQTMQLTFLLLVWLHQRILINPAWQLWLDQETQLDAWSCILWTGRLLQFLIHLRVHLRSMMVKKTTLTHHIFLMSMECKKPLATPLSRNHSYNAIGMLSLVTRERWRYLTDKQETLIPSH